MSQIVKSSMRSIGRLLCAASLLVVAHTVAEAEIGRVAIDEVMQELYAAKRAATPDRTEISFPVDDLVSMLPGMARVVVADGAEPMPASVRAIFAVRQPGGEIGDTKTVHMRQVDGQTYVVARRSKRTFRSWLLKRRDDLFAGSVVLERIVGLEPDYLVPPVG